MLIYIGINENIPDEMGEINELRYYRRNLL